MSQLLTANIGSYPRIGEDKDQQRHRRGLGHLQKKELSKHAFRDIENSVIQEVVREQIEAGIDEITDGTIGWHDPISHFTRHMSGIKNGGLGRFFDNNFYYRVPIIFGNPKRKDPFVVQDYLTTQYISNKPVRVVLTGPYTLAQHTQSQNKSFQKLQARLDLFSSLLREEILDLTSNGTKIIQIDEPAILKHPEDIKIFSKSIEKCVNDHPHTRIILAVYFSSAVSLYDSLMSLPIDVLNIDCTIDSKRTMEKILSGHHKTALGLGLVNARSTRMEPIDPLLNMIKRIQDHTKAPYTYITPSAGLEYLPRMYAFAKLKMISKLKNELT